MLRAIGERNLKRVVSFGGRDLIGRALEVVQRPWKAGRFGGRRASSEYLGDRTPVIIVERQRS